MSFLLRIIGGIACTAVGLFFVIKTEWFMQNFGEVAWAQEHLGFQGGSRLFYKLIGLAIILVGFMWATDLLGGFLRGTVGALLVPGGPR